MIHSPSYEEAPLDIAEEAELHYARFGAVNAVEIDRDDEGWLLRILFDDENDAARRMPTSFHGLRVRFGFERFTALGA